MPRASSRAFEQPAGRLVELALHQRRHQVDDGDLHAAQRRPVRRLEPEQTAADHHRRAARLARAASIASTSSRSRKVTTPGRSSPGTGMMNGSEPVAISSLS